MSPLEKSSASAEEGRAAARAVEGWKEGPLRSTQSPPLTLRDLRQVVRSLSSHISMGMCVQGLS